MDGIKEAERKLEKPMKLDDHELHDILLSVFNFETIKEMKELDSYDDRNYYIRTNDNQEFVLKIHNGVETRNHPFILSQIACLKLLNSKPNIQAPVDLPGCTQFIRLSNGRRHFIRLLKYIPGMLLYDKVISSKSENDRYILFEQFGRFLANVDQVLNGFEKEHPAVIRGLLWDLKKFQQISSFVHLISDNNKRLMIETVLEEFKLKEKHVLHLLPCSVIQNDANDRNFVISSLNNEFAMLDFGDMIYTWTICEISIALAYIIVGFFTDESSEELDRIWLNRCLLCFKGYNSTYKCSKTEISVIHLLIRSRLATSACIGAYSASLDPDNVYLLLHSEPAWRSLRAINRFSESDFTNYLETGNIE